MHWKIQGEIPEMSVGSALPAVSDVDWACTPASAAAATRAESVNFIVSWE